MYLIRMVFIFFLFVFSDLSAMYDYLGYLDFYVSEELLDDFFYSKEFEKCCNYAKATNELDLSNFSLKKLNKLPEDKEELFRKIKTLKLVNCKISKISRVFFSFFPVLEFLDLSNNNLSSFPKILCLENLKELYLNNNPIRFRPSSGFMFSLINMENLKILSLIKNPLGKNLFWYYCKTFTDIDPTEDPAEVENRPHRLEIENKLKEIIVIDEMFTPALERLINQLIQKKTNC